MSRGAGHISSRLVAEGDRRFLRVCQVLFAIFSNFFSLHRVHKSVRDAKKEGPWSVMDQGLGKPNGYYHIATGALLFGAEAILRDSTIEVVSNAAWHAPSGTLSTMFQAGALIELSGDVETAFEIYYETYDIHELPPLHKDS